MEVQVIVDRAHPWHQEEVDGRRISVAGSFRHGGRLYRGSAACRKILELFPLDPHGGLEGTSALVREVIEGVRGHFSFVVETDDHVLACVDRIRSYPVFYSQGRDALRVSNSAPALQAAAGLSKGNPVARIEFAMAGYVTGGDTLVEDLHQLVAGEFLLCGKREGRSETVRYYRYFPDARTDAEDHDLLEGLHGATVKTFEEMVETLDGRPVWIPLSGGLDSRLVLAMLHEMGYPDITTFTYGVPGLWEATEARKIALHLGVRWHYVPYEPRKIKRMFHTEERERYFRFASGSSSVPFLSDFYAIWLLREQKAIPGDAVFVNGQTGDYLTGGHIPRRIEAVEGPGVEARVLARAIVDKHFSLWTDIKTEENLALVEKRILEGLGLSPGAVLSREDFARYHELHEWQERQTKYVVNGQRMYEWFGYEWRLPHWSDDLMAFWAGVIWRKKLAQKLYKDYLRRHDFARVFSIPPTPAVPYVPLGLKVLHKAFSAVSVVTGLSATQMLQTYSRYFMTSAPYYPQRTYLEYLKDSRWHRGPVSYLAKEVLRAA